MSYSGRSNVSGLTSNRRISTKVSLGKSDPPILPSNNSDSSKPSLSEVGLPTEVVGPRFSTPSPSHNKFDSSPTVISPSQQLLDIPLTLSSALPHLPKQPEMGSILSAAAVRLLDPFDDDEDDDAMRRLCASPVLHPNNSISKSIATTANASSSLRIPETQVLASSESIRPFQDKSITGRSRESASFKAGEGQVIAGSTAEETSYHGIHHTENPRTSNQRFYFTSEVPNNAHGSPPDAGNSRDKIESTDKSCPDASLPSFSVAQQSDSAIPIRDSGKSSRKITLEDRIAAIEDALAAAISPSYSSKEDDSTSLASRSNVTSGSGGTGSKKPVADKQLSLEDRIAYLESLVFKMDVTPTTSTSPSPPPASKLQLLPRQAVSHPAPVTSTRDMAPPESKSASTAATDMKPSGPLRYFAPPPPARRVSSASSESYEPGSPAHTASSELADFKPGEFVLSSDALEAHAATFIAPTSPKVAIKPSEIENVRKPIEVEQQEGADSADNSGDIPQFTSRVQLPPNMDVPPVPTYGQIKSPRHRSRNEPTRAHVHPSVLQHPMPRRGTSTATTSMLEESADRRSAQPLEVDLTVEYEDQPVDIAARSVKPPPKESISKVKFADSPNEDEQEAEAPMRRDDIKPSDVTAEDGTRATSTLQLATPSVSAIAKPVNNAPTPPEKPAIVEFGFEETDILKGLTMPNLARGDSDTSSETSDSDSQPESPAEDIRSVSMLAGKHGISKKDGSQAVAQFNQASAAVLSASSPSNPERVSLSRSSSRSSSPSGRSDDSKSSASDGAKDKVTAAIKVSAPPIRWGGSLMKKEGRKSGQQQPRFGRRYGMQSGYSGPARSFRTFEHPSGPTGWRGSAAVEVPRSVVHPETAYDVAQEQGGNVALASFLDNYETELSSKVTLEDDMSPAILQTRKSISIIGASAREREKERKNEVEQSELDIFDELLALT